MLFQDNLRFQPCSQLKRSWWWDKRIFTRAACSCDWTRCSSVLSNHFICVGAYLPQAATCALGSALVRGDPELVR